jgi:hypothetical protein
MEGCDLTVWVGALFRPRSLSMPWRLFDIGHSHRDRRFRVRAPKLTCPSFGFVLLYGGHDLAVLPVGAIYNRACNTTAALVSYALGLLGAAFSRDRLLTSTV